MNCPICLETYSTPTILHDNHIVCITCNDKLRTHRIRSCPLCREPINQDLEPIHIKVVSTMQLRAFSISEEFINHIFPSRLPFYYTNSTDGVEFVREMRQLESEYSLSQ